MIRRVLFVAILAGLVAGILVTAAQMARVTPLIQQAESYETKSEDPAAVWSPADGVERTAFTLLANVLTAVGFGLLLNAALALHGGPVGLKKGVLWGLAGFSVFVLAPALGLPPELPGAHAADLMHRQAWHLGAVLAAGGGLAVIVFVRNHAFKAAGAALIAAPHIIGAPHPHELGGGAPPELAAAFVVASLSTAALLWIVLGGVSGFLHARFANSV